MTDWAIRQGRAALFEDCGLGKSVQELVWAQNVHKHTGKPVLLLTPLAVTFQMEAEAAKFGIEAAISRDGRVTAPVTVTNYERLAPLRPGRLRRGGVRRVIRDQGVRRETPRDGDRVPAEDAVPAAGHRDGRAERLHRARHLIGGARLPGADGHARPGSSSTTRRRSTPRGHYSGFSAPRPYELPAWRFKGHAEEQFWRWVASWARAMRKPSDYGFDDDGFDLPPLEYRQHVVNPGTPSGRRGPVRRARHRAAGGTRRAAPDPHRAVREGRRAARGRRRRGSPGAT